MRHIQHTGRYQANARHNSAVKAEKYGMHRQPGGRTSTDRPRLQRLVQKRRDMHRPHLESAGICAPQVPMSTKWLHPEGSEFHKSLKEARETRRLGQDMRGQASRRGQGQWHRGNSNAFLGRLHWKHGGSYSNRRPWTQGKRGAGHQGVSKARH